MLRRLDIRNYGLIRHAEILFGAGATMFTGETGSGKTMILGALGFALGARSSADVVGHFGERAIVTLAFEPDALLAQRLSDEGFELDPGEVATIEREMTAAGKTQLRLNGRSATASVVRAFATSLAEIVGQHEAQRLLSAQDHLELLDRFGGQPLLHLREQAGQAYVRYAALVREREEMQAEARTAQERYDAARAALDSIDAVAPQSGEDERLETRRRVLDNAERIALALSQSHDVLAGDESSAVSALGSARAALEGIASYAPALSELASAAAALQEEVTDLAVRIAREAGDSDYDARELESINERLAGLDALKRAYGPGLDAVLARAVSARSTVDAFEHRDEAFAKVTAHVADAQASLDTAASALTKARAKAAKALAAAVETEFAELALSAARFEARLVPLSQPGALGAESVEFYFSANPGETAKPLAKVASGGELSRVLLALIVATNRGAASGALIFDEIDAGIGGATATAVGTRLGRLSREAQVVCVTHLAQLATWAQRHYVLVKSDDGATTVITVHELSGSEERAAELARMLSGDSHDAALAHARTLLQQAAS